MVRHDLDTSDRRYIEEDEQLYWRRLAQVVNTKTNGLSQVVASNSLSFSEPPTPHSFLSKNHSRTFSSPSSRPSTPDLGRGRTDPPGLRSWSITRRRSRSKTPPPTARASTPTLLKPADPLHTRHKSRSPQQNSSNQYHRAPSPQIRAYGRPTRFRPRPPSPPTSSDEVFTPSPIFEPQNPPPTEDLRFTPSPYVYDDGIRDHPPPPPNTNFDDTRQESPYNQPTDSTNNAPRSTTDPGDDPNAVQRMINSSKRDDGSVESELGQHDLLESPITTKNNTSSFGLMDISPMDQTTINPQPLGLPSPSLIERRNSSSRKSRARSPFLESVKHTKLQPEQQHCHGELPTETAPKNDESHVASSETLDRQVDSPANSILDEDENSANKERQESDNHDNDFGFGRILSGAFAYFIGTDVLIPVPVGPPQSNSKEEMDAATGPLLTSPASSQLPVAGVRPQSNGKEEMGGVTGPLLTSPGLSSKRPVAVGPPQSNSKEEKMDDAMGPLLTSRESASQRPPEKRNQKVAPDMKPKIRNNSSFKDQIEGDSSLIDSSKNMVFHVRLNVESLMGVTANHRNFRRKNDHFLMQGYVEVVNPSMIARNSSALVASQADIASEVGTSKQVCHCFVWPDNVKDKSRNRLYLTLPLYQKQNTASPGDTIARFATVQLRIGVKRGDEHIPLGDTFLVLDLPNVDVKSFDLPIRPLKKESTKKMRGLFSKKKGDTSYGLEHIALLRCIAHVQQGLDTHSGATFWGDKRSKRRGPSQGVVHKLCSQNANGKTQNHPESRKWRKSATRAATKLEKLKSNVYASALLHTEKEEENVGATPYFAASPFVNNVLGEGTASENDYDKLERMRSPASQVAQPIAFEINNAARNDMEQPELSHQPEVEPLRIKEDRDYSETPANAESEVRCFMDPGCSTFLTLGRQRIAPAADSVAISTTEESLTAKPTLKLSAKPDPPSVDADARQLKESVDMALARVKTESNDEALATTEEFSRIRKSDNDISTIGNPGTDDAANGSTMHEQGRIEFSDDPKTKLAELPSKLPSTRNMRTQHSEEFTEWDEGPGGRGRRFPFFNCVCAEEVDNDTDRSCALEKGDPDHADQPPLVRNCSSFVSADGFETVMEKELDQGNSMIGAISSTLSNDFVWPAVKDDEGSDPIPLESPLSSSSSVSSPRGFLPQKLSKHFSTSPRKTTVDSRALFTPSESVPSNLSFDSSGHVFLSQKLPKPPSSSPRKHLNKISFAPRLVSPTSNPGIVPHKFSEVSGIPSNPTGLSVDSEDFTDGKLDEAARKIFQAAEKVGITAEQLIDQLEKGEEIETLLSRKIQERQYTSRQPSRKPKHGRYK